jgi:uncharacterized protein (UPF0262 family)
MSREKLAKATKLGKQRAYGVIDILEDLGLVDVDRTIKPYQVRLSELGKRFIPFLAKHNPSEIVKSILKE